MQFGAANPGFSRRKITPSFPARPRAPARPGTLFRDVLDDCLAFLRDAFPPLFATFVACICISIVAGGVMLAVMMGMHECLVR